MTKKELREKYIQIRKNIKNKEELSNQIANKVLESLEYANAKTICLYKSFGSEVDTSEIIKQALKDGKTVGLPVVSETSMDFYKIDIIEADQDPSLDMDECIEPKTIDLIIVPGICFDLENNRIGFGKGYYDKYLSNKELTATKIGICFEEQILKHGLIDIEPHDVKMDKVLHSS